jgi:hypothetical protein
MIGIYWVMMTQFNAIVASILTLLAMYLWYHYCLRIYNRFNWDRFYTAEWQDADEAAEERKKFGDLDPDRDVAEIPVLSAIFKAGNANSTNSGGKNGIFSPLCVVTVPYSIPRRGRGRGHPQWLSQHLHRQGFHPLSQ